MSGINLSCFQRYGNFKGGCCLVSVIGRSLQCTFAQNASVGAYVLTSSPCPRAGNGGHYCEFGQFYAAAFVAAFNYLIKYYTILVPVGLLMVSFFYTAYGLSGFLHVIAKQSWDTTLLHMEQFKAYFCLATGECLDWWKRTI